MHPYASEHRRGLRCGLLGFVLGESTLRLRRHSIATVCNLEAISRKVTEAILGWEKTARQPMTRVV